MSHFMQCFQFNMHLIESVLVSHFQNLYQKDRPFCKWKILSNYFQKGRSFLYSCNKICMSRKIGWLLRIAKHGSGSAQTCSALASSSRRRRWAAASTLRSPTSTTRATRTSPSSTWARGPSLSVIERLKQVIFHFYLFKELIACVL